jgi:hypothetical protein
MSLCSTDEPIQPTGLTALSVLQYINAPHFRHSKQQANFTAVETQEPAASRMAEGNAKRYIRRPTELQTGFCTYPVIFL